MKDTLRFMDSKIERVSEHRPSHLVYIIGDSADLKKRSVYNRIFQLCCQISLDDNLLHAVYGSPLWEPDGKNSNLLAQRCT